MKTKLKTIYLTLTIAAALVAAPAFASDLSNDLRTAFAPLSNPFEHTAAKPLATDAANTLRNILSRCAFTPVQAPSVNMSNAVYFDAALEKSCAPEITASYVKDKNGKKVVGNSLIVHSDGLYLQVVSWDGSQSDGGDEQAIGVYDFNGNRVAVYPGIYAIGNVLDGLAHAVGMSLRTR